MSSVTLILLISCAARVFALTDQLISLTVAPCSFAAKTTDHFFSHYKKGRNGGVFVNDVGLQSWFKVFFPIYLNCSLDGRPAYNLVYKKKAHLSEKGTLVSL